MQAVLNLAVYLAAGAVGGLVGARTKIPAGVLVGSVLAVILVKHLAGKSWDTPKSFEFISQVILGVLVALTYSPGMFKNFGPILAAIAGSSVVLTIAGLLMALALKHWGLMDLPTAYIATSPGAMTALVPMAIDMNVNAALIAQFHFFRIFFITLSAPFVFKFICR